MQKYDAVEFEFSKPLTDAQEKHFIIYFNGIQQNTRQTLQAFIQDPKSNGFIQQMIHFVRNTYGMDLTLIIETYAKTLLNDLDNSVRLWQNDDDPRKYTFYISQKMEIKFPTEKIPALRLMKKARDNIEKDMTRKILPLMGLRQDSVRMRHFEAEVELPYYYPPEKAK